MSGTTLMDFAFTAATRSCCARRRARCSRASARRRCVRAHIDDPSARRPALAPPARVHRARRPVRRVDLCVFIEELGYVAAPGPFFATAVLFAPLLDARRPRPGRRRARRRRHRHGRARRCGRRVGANDEPVKTFVPEADRVDRVAVGRRRPDGPVVRSTAGARRAGSRRSTPSRRVFERRHAPVAARARALSTPTSLDARARAGDRRARGRDGRHRAAAVRR